jgi:hypothetical protein
MFQLEVMTPIRLVDVVVLSQKNRAPEEGPGAKLKLAVDVPNDALSMFDGRLLSALYTKNGDGGNVTQIPLEGVTPVSDAPDLTPLGQHMPRLPWSEVCEGYTLTLDVGTRHPVVILNCIASGWKIAPKAGGTINVKFDVESSDVSEPVFGKLAKHKSREVKATLVQAEEGDEQRSLDEDRQDRQDEPAAGAAPAAAKKARKPRTLAQKVARAARENRAAAQ